MNIIQKIGVVTSLVLASNFSMADVIYNLNNFEPDEPISDTIDSYWSETWFEALETGLFTDTLIFKTPDVDESLIFTAVIDSSDVTFTEFMFQGRTGSIIDSEGTNTARLGIFRSDGLYDGEQPFRLAPNSSYTMYLSGKPNFLGGSYEYGVSLNLYTSVSPVPEPSSIALMLGGLGLVGFMAARRRKQS